MRGFSLPFARFKTGLAAAAAGMIVSASVQAHAVECINTTCTLASSAAIAFQPTITITKNADIDFGTVLKGNCIYSIDTSGTVTGSPPVNCSTLSGSPHAANLTVKGSASMQVTISVGGYTADSTVTPSAARGKYNNGTEQAFPLNNVAAPTSAGKTLLIGASVTTAGTETNGASYAPSFTITVLYP
ncbi:MAG: DUF4402 domain-containing protein [Alphaproteobacteria bacterium]